MFKNISIREKIMGGFLLALVLFFILWKGCDQKQTDNLLDNALNYKDSAMFYKIKVNGMEVDVAYNKSLVLQNKDQMEAMLRKNDTLSKLISKFKDIKSTTIINQYTTINGDTIKLKGDSIPCDFKPFKVRRDSAHYKFVGTIASKYFSIDTLSIPNKVSIVIGLKKMGFLKRGEERAEIINSNPLVKTTNIGNYVVIPKRKKIGVGASVGYGLSLSGKPILAPYVGVSLNYNLFEF